jgi:hypothetical protein
MLIIYQSCGRAIYNAHKVQSELPSVVFRYVYLPVVLKSHLYIVTYAGKVGRVVEDVDMSERGS